MGLPSNKLGVACKVIRVVVRNHEELGASFGSSLLTVPLSGRNIQHCERGGTQDCVKRMVLKAPTPDPLKDPKNGTPPI